MTGDNLIRITAKPGGLDEDSFDYDEDVLEFGENGISAERLDGWPITYEYDGFEHMMEMVLTEEQARELLIQLNEVLHGS